MNRYNPEGFRYDPAKGVTVDKWGRVREFDLRGFRKARGRVVNPARKGMTVKET